VRAMRRVTILAVCVALAGCGGGDDGGGSSAAPSGDTVTISMKDLKFDPNDATVKVGRTVHWVNDDTVDHNAVANSGADFKSDLFGKGDSFDWKAEKAGTVKYECTIHPGMGGTLNVTQ
jgi:plastocyanin